MKLIPRLLVCCLAFFLGVTVKHLLLVPDYPPITKLDNVTPTLPSPPQFDSSIQTEVDRKILDTFFAGEELSYHDYQISKRHKTVILDDDPTHPISVDVSYLQLTKGDRVLATFDGFEGVYHPTGNITEFGLFQLLNNDTKQLVVQQLAWRMGRQWVVQLSPTFKILYDSGKWNTGQEYIKVVDLDGDRNCEIIQESNGFYDFADKMASVSIPRPTIVFRYNRKSSKFVPANLAFADYLMRDLVKAHVALNEKPQPLLLHEVLPVAIDYMYVGRQREGWALFEHLYRYDDKREVRRRLQAILRRELVYRYIQ